MHNMIAAASTVVSISMALGAIPDGMIAIIACTFR